MTTVVFTEKNKAAAQISNILAGGSARRKIVDGVPVYEFQRNGVPWKVMGLAGHIMGYDYPEEFSNWRDVDPAMLLDTEPIKKVTKAKFGNAILKLSKDSDLLVLACDFDREGENIGFEARSIAEKVSGSTVKRARFSSLSKSEIDKAFTDLVEPDENMAMSAEARQILDLKMGAAFTRFVTLSVRERARTKGVLSIGPCQTPTCGFVYERELAIRKFDPKDFWKIEGIFNGKGTDFVGVHRGGHIYDKEKADAIFSKLKNCRTAVVSKKTVKEMKTNPPFPLNTNEFLKRSSKYLGVSPEQALEIAEQLYLSGFTSYPRTETNKYADDMDFKKILKGFTRGDYQDFSMLLLSQDKITPRNGKKDGHDHPPIHPIKAGSRAEVEKAVKMPRAWDVYDLIVRHFIANLLPEAIFEKTRFELTVEGEVFDSTGSVQKSAGWLAVYPFEKPKDKLLPLLEEKDVVDVKRINNIKSQTTPPKRLTEAELLTLMDKHGIGTKATAPSHIETNKKRGYFETKGKTIAIMDTGFTLMDALNSSVPILVKPDIRARIEALIQEVEDGTKKFPQALEEGTSLIKEMYSQLLKNRELMVSQIAGTITDEAVAADKKNHIGTCPDCGRMLRIVSTDKGRFVGCTGYPQCKNTYPLPKTGALAVQRSRKCKKDGIAVIKVGNKYYWSVGIGPCFSCELEKECFPPEVIGPCPSCDGQMFLITTKDSRFLGCTKRCGHTQSVPKKGRLTVTDKICEGCGWHFIRVKEQGKEAKEYCANRKCEVAAAARKEAIRKTRTR
ncbi:MAG: DNA topoisomerase I [Halobacteriota archaeon]